MNRLAFAIVLAVIPANRSAFPQTIPCETCPVIECGETKQIRADGGHTLTVVYKYNATAGDVVSFESAVVAGDLEYQLSVLGAVVDSQLNNEAWICGWDASETGEYLVSLYGAATWGWNVSLTMYCGPPPESCAVSLVAETWSHVKALFR